MQAMAKLRTHTAAIFILLAITTFAEVPEPNIEPTVRISRGKVDDLPEPKAGTVVRGTLTNDQGTPLEGVAIGCSPSAMELQFEADQRAVTDAMGRYSIDLPWSGIEYDVTVQDERFQREPKKIEGAPGQVVDFVLVPQEREESDPRLENYTCYGVVRDALTGEVVAGASVVQDGGWGKTRRTLSDLNGRFEFPPDPYFRTASVVARYAEKVTPVTDSDWERDIRVDLSLALPGEVAGTVSMRDGSGPASGYVVALTNGPKQFEARYVVTTDQEGKYEFKDLPPDNYRFATYFPYPGNGSDEFIGQDESVTVTPGEVSRLELLAESPVHISGQVVGPNGEPASFAMVQSGSAFGWNVMADEKGFFSESVPVSALGQITALSPKFGRGALALLKLSPGEKAKNLVIRLNGMARLSGTLRGPANEPIADVRLRNTASSETGHFDSGFIPVPANPEDIKIDIYPPRPYSGLYMGSAMLFGHKTDEKDSFYYAAPVFVKASHGEDIHLDITLVKAPLRALRGTVVSPEGTPESGVSIFVYAGMPTTEQWLKHVAPERPTGAQTGGPTPNPATLVATTTTDDSGNWSLRMVPEVGDRSPAYGDEYHPDNLVVFAVDREQRRMAMMARQIVSDYESMFEFPMILRPAPPELVMWARVVDTGGKPLAGVQWYVNNSFGTYVSDALGLVPINRLREVPSLKLINQEYCMVEALPQAAGPITGQRVANIPHVARVITYAWPGPEPKRGIQGDGKFLILDFVDDENACIVITLDRCEEKEGTTP
jgi:hypothetical protein